MAALITGLLVACLTTINIMLAIRNYLREREQRRHPTPHPLEAAVRDIAAAVREGPEYVRLWHPTRERFERVRVRDVMEWR